MHAALTWQGYARTIWCRTLFCRTETCPSLFDCAVDGSIEWWCSLKGSRWWCSNKWWCKPAQVLQFMPRILHSIIWYHIFDDVYWSWLIAYIARQWHTDSWEWHTSSPLSFEGQKLVRHWCKLPVRLTTAQQIQYTDVLPAKDECLFCRWLVSPQSSSALLGWMPLSPDWPASSSSGWLPQL